MATAVPPPPLSALPGGFLKQLVRDSEKETKHKEPEVKEEKQVRGFSPVSDVRVGLIVSPNSLNSDPLQPSKLSDNLVQQFLVPDQTPPILEAEMALRAEQLLSNSRQGRTSAQSDCKSPSQRLIVSPEPDGKQEVEPQPQRQQQDVRSEKKTKKTPQSEQKKERIEEVKKVEKKEEKKEERQEPEGRQADTEITEQTRREVCNPGVIKDGFTVV